jgi:hypothetical protein
MFDNMKRVCRFSSKEQVMELALLKHDDVTDQYDLRNSLTLLN